MRELASRPFAPKPPCEMNSDAKRAKRDHPEAELCEECAEVHACFSPLADSFR